MTYAHEKDQRWLVRKSGPKPLTQRGTYDPYEHHDRACRAYSHWISGYTEEEIADYLAISLDDAKKDIQHIQGSLSTRTLISQNNDRNRILLQRTESDNYRRLLSGALAMSAQTYLDAGINPASTLKEFREAVGMQEKPGGLTVAQVTQVTNVHGGISSSEDALRQVLAKLDEPTTINATAEAVTVSSEEDEVPEDDVFTEEGN